MTGGSPGAEHYHYYLRYREIPWQMRVEHSMAPEKKNVLLFTTYKFRDETNLTVRRGIQLASKLTMGDTIWLQSREGGEQRRALVTGLKVKRFRDIREQDLSVEHDPQCRSWNDLFATMKKLYDDFDETEIVTMIYFTTEEGE
jgi:hypothetical protein